jgi:regulator of protease activity HflC (stomatin/prohibitin superfamily)
MLKIIQQSTTGVLTTFGKFSGLKRPGLHIYIPFVQRIYPVSNRLRQDAFKFEVKTKDNVFANISVAVQYQVMSEDTEKSFFSLDRPVDQMNAYIENVVRSVAPQKKLDDLFESQNDICHNVSKNLSAMMKEYGFTIVNTLVTGIEPNKEVKDAMNKINATDRLKIAATNEADAHYIKEFRQAEADKERKKLQGEGISEQRKAILKGYQTGMDDMAKKTGLSAQDVMKFVMMTQHLDTVEAIGKSPNAKTLFLNHAPEGLATQFKENMIQASEVAADVPVKKVEA